jgi:hypothetical protein
VRGFNPFVRIDKNPKSLLVFAAIFVLIMAAFGYLLATTDREAADMVCVAAAQGD